jgi:bacterioferritin-associated ferredoxin
MYVCICRQITDRQIRDLCQNGSANLAEVRARLGVASECGKCTRMARTIVSEFVNPPSFTNAAAG